MNEWIGTISKGLALSDSHIFSIPISPTPTCTLASAFSLQTPPVFNNKWRLHFDSLHLTFLI